MLTRLLLVAGLGAAQVQKSLADSSACSATTTVRPSGTATPVTVTVTETVTAVASTASALVKPKVFIINHFALEEAAWTEPLKLTKLIAAPGFSPLFPDAKCNAAGAICQLTTGEGEINAASTISALIQSGKFDLSTTYFLVAGIAGINPACGTLGSVALQHYAVQVDLAYEIDPRELTSNYSSGYIPLGAQTPLQYPGFLYGTEVFEVNAALRDKVLSIASNVTLNDSSIAAEYRTKYTQFPASQPPKVFAGDGITSDVFWHGELLGKAFSQFAYILTNGSSTYCVTAQEDNAVLEAMLRGAMAKQVDFSRIILMRAASNFDRPPPGVTAAQQLFYTNQGGFAPSVQNLYLAGRPIIDEIVGNWDDVYDGGIEPLNYIGDIYGSIKGQKYRPDIG
ncbi:hypothetical protein BP5796_06502 [Coleophoma crateriformis]|uniref:Purine nucleoside permease n=1 Tax=Coleophoma crateriformis TaxID=565419 RepID=A0A3D8RPE5_9HELO|nr:hypothetical protein BP5796_06502 [Coleophoma crateriformis]